jgi:hypothetical protein
MYVKFRAIYDGSTWNAEAEDVDIFVIGTSIRNLMENVEVAANDFFRDLLPEGEKLHIVVVNESAAGAISVPPSADLSTSSSTL